MYIQYIWVFVFMYVCVHTYLFCLQKRKGRTATKEAKYAKKLNELVRACVMSDELCGSGVSELVYSREKFPHPPPNWVSPLKSPSVVHFLVKSPSGPFPCKVPVVHFLVKSQWSISL